MSKAEEIKVLRRKMEVCGRTIADLSKKRHVRVKSIQRMNHEALIDRAVRELGPKAEPEARMIKMKEIAGREPELDPINSKIRAYENQLRKLQRQLDAKTKRRKPRPTNPKRRKL